MQFANAKFAQSPADTDSPQVPCPFLELKEPIVLTADDVVASPPALIRAGIETRGSQRQPAREQ